MIELTKMASEGLLKVGTRLLDRFTPDPAQKAEQTEVETGQNVASKQQ